MPPVAMISSLPLVARASPSIREPGIVRHDAPTGAARELGVEGPHAEIEFDFTLHEAGPDLPPDIVQRERAGTEG